MVVVSEAAHVAPNTTVLPRLPAGIEVTPLVTFSILDHFSRREEDQKKVIGTLLGKRSADGTVRVTGSFPVPHNESADVVAVDMEFHKMMFDLHRRVNTKEQIVGWYSSSGEDLSYNSVLVHEFFESEVQSPVYLTVDPTLQSTRDAMAAGGPHPARRIPMKGYVSRSLRLGDKELGSQFVDVDVSVVDEELIDMLFAKSTPPAGSAPDAIVDASMSAAPLSDFKALDLSLKTILSFLDKVAVYIADVVDGKIAADEKVKAALIDTLNCVPALDVPGFQEVMGKSVNDLKMVLQLSSMTQHQLKVSERLVCL